MNTKIHSGHSNDPLFHHDDSMFSWRVRLQCFNAASELARERLTLQEFQDSELVENALMPEEVQFIIRVIFFWEAMECELEDVYE
ncbi:hypothetical protein QJS10_CPA01g01299 [Acorus calamus]|uniref:Uncharacterized protein n=1 Tax=Acorus calamus TaxID=4465 RepID=A0AAV9FMH9_ACOCL|nr:hypothetical protein QJS10_CPA01g01299 [Acorus calamus]